MRSLARCLLVVCLALQASCRAKNDRIPVFHVSGKVLYQGQPAAGAIVAFVPLDEPFALKPHGVSGPEGDFQLSTYELNDGVPRGRYGVTIKWPGPNPRSNGEGDEEIQGPDRLGGRYGSPQASKWKIEVAQEPLELEPFDVE
ncbi:MAG TPA: carboxypeptidase-like regulatory domain-containing protein [Pirellulales bacterium]|nr:carboxypeptidase-like regulatory domain-containing protein [Pirellulales bacterium]